ncbi:hypothetical protein [Clostridium tagluense]|nr:hypothetical protein [Clostridium tagluense]
MGGSNYSDIFSVADNKIHDTEKRINDLVSNIYNLDDFEKKKIQL